MRSVRLGCALVVGWVCSGSAPARSAPGVEAVFETIDFHAVLLDRPPAVMERPGYVGIRAPLLTANATVRCTVPAGESWTVGFIQQLDSSEWKNDYDYAITSWEFARLPVSDARRKTVPWYGDQPGESTALSGAVAGRVVELAMDDEPWAQATWEEPLPPHGENRRSDSRLRGVQRKQRYTLWLAAVRASDTRVLVLQKAIWEWEAVVQVHPEKPLGSRAVVVPRPVVQPVVSSGGGETIPSACLGAPIANDAQEFWWTPKGPADGKRTRLKAGQ